MVSSHGALSVLRTLQTHGAHGKAGVSFDTILLGGLGVAVSVPSGSFVQSEATDVLSSFSEWEISFLAVLFILSEFLCSVRCVGRGLFVGAWMWGSLGDKVRLGR